MGNINNYNFNYLDLRLSNSDYWDFFLNRDNTNNGNCNNLTGGECFVAWFNFSHDEVFINGFNTIASLVTWTGATNSGYTFDTIGLTGIDNGLITFDKQIGDDTNLALLSALTGTTLIIPSYDTRLTMNRVTGTTGNFIYPMDKRDNGTFKFMLFDGGFYQGYYKLDGYSYEVLPTRVNESWSAEFWLNREEVHIIPPIDGPKLNDIYPDNKGFFFYMGTRAENKFWNQWTGDCATDCVTTTACTATTFCTIPKESEISILGDFGVPIPLDPPRIDINLVTNGFLIYGRAHDTSAPKLALTGETFIINPTVINTGTTNNCHVCGGPHDGLGTQRACTYDGNGIAVVSSRTIRTNNTNPFLIYGRARANRNCCDTFKENDGLGNQTVWSFSGFTKPETQLDYKVDVVDNALGFRITDDGRIGYRLLKLTTTCENDIVVSGVSIEENYSEAGLIDPILWTYVVIKFKTDFKTDCELKDAAPRKGKLMFYINGKLKYTVNDFDEFIAKRLDEYKDKQLGVPFNFSLGGGSQGLIESQTFGGQDPSDFGLEIQQNFAGTFIGSIADFKFNICDLTYCNIQNTYINNGGLYFQSPISFGHC